MWSVNLRSNETKSLLFEYIEENFIESVLGITTNDTKDLINLTVQQKKKKKIENNMILLVAQPKKFMLQDQKDTQF